jgi:hypothetical protein
MKKSSIILITFLLFYSNFSLSQSNKTNQKSQIINTYFNEKKYSFLDPKFKIIINQTYNNYVEKTTPDRPGTIKYTNLIEKFNEFPNNWFYLQNKGTNAVSYFLKNKNGEISKVLKYEDNTPFLLNDSTIWYNNSSLYNLYNDQILFDSDNYKYFYYSPQHLNVVNNLLLKSDIQINQYYSYKYFFNTFKDGVFVSSEANAFKDYVIDNPSSKYLMFNDAFIPDNGMNYWGYSLINRYDVNDTLEINAIYYGNSNVSSTIYNDSVLYSVIPISASEKLLDYDYNKIIDVIYTKNGFEKDNEFFKKYWKGSSGTDEGYNAVQTCYFFKKYNKIDISKIELEEFKNYYNTYRNLLNENPYLIVEYNFITKRIVSIMDKPIIPLKKVIKSYLDNTNSLLITQEIDNTISIFNLLSKKMIITFKGNIGQLNFKNELILNSYGSYNYLRSPSSPEKIYFDKINLNELLSLKKESFVNEITSSLNLDEFYQKNVFDSKLKQISELNLQILKNDVNTIENLKKDKTKITYSNKEIYNKISNQIKQYNSFIYGTSDENPPNKTFSLKYFSYSMDTKQLELITDNENELDLIKNYNTEKVTISDERYSGKNYVIIRLKNINSDLAKKLKESKISLTLKVEDNRTDIILPSYDKIFVFRYPNKQELNDKKSYDEFYRKNVPVKNSKLNIHNSYYLNINGNEELIYRKNL